MALTVLQVETIARDYSGDDDTSSGNWGVSEPSQLRQLNRIYIRWRSLLDQRIYELTALTTGLQYTLNTDYYKTTSVVNIADIVEAIRLVAASTFEVAQVEYAVLERVTVAEHEEWLRDYPANGLPKRWAAERVGTATDGSKGAWKVFIHPPLDAGTYGTFNLGLRVRQEAVALVNPTDKLDLSDDEAYGIAALLGAWHAQQVSNSDLVARAMADVPDAMKAALARYVVARRPLARADQDTI